jgi:cyclopropane-fatty-acyl-phospholipid synthase
MLRASTIKNTVIDLFSKADIKIGGSRPWDLRVKDERFYERVYHYHNLGMGEAYMDSWVECDALDEFAYRVLSSNLKEEVEHDWRTILRYLWSRAVNAGAKCFAFEVGRRHYDIGNDLYRLMLDKRMVYSCGYWKNAKTLDEAQEAKLDLICKKIGLRPGMKVLDIGCGWGSFAKFAAEKYGASVVGITVSKEQAKLAREACKGLLVEIRLQDYRDVKEGQYDSIVSIGMFEHVCYKNYRTFMEIVAKLLKPEGLSLLHTIGRKCSETTSDPWMDKYIFPHSMLPSITQIGEASEGLFIMEDWHNFGFDYSLTLMEWYKNISSRWSALGDRYDERFKRMWTYYLLTCAGSFRARDMQLWQVMFSKRGVRGGYVSVR